MNYEITYRFVIAANQIVNSVFTASFSVEILLTTTVEPKKTRASNDRLDYEKT